MASEPQDDEKFKLLTTIWPRMTRVDFNTCQELCKLYFLFVDEQISSVHRKSSLYSAQTINELLSMIQHIRKHKDQTKAELFSDTSLATMRSADVAIRIWLTLDVPHLSDDSSPVPRWDSKITLPAFLSTRFTFPVTSRHNSPRQIPETFSVANLVQYYKFRISWTSDLSRHLRIDWEYKQITIFEHAICLRNHLEYADDCPLPKPLVLEAIDTIKLLFPDDKNTKALLAKEGRNFLKIPYGRERSLSLSTYHYWQGNISLLLDHWEQGSKGWSQIRLSPDRDNLLEYVTFWAATTVLILTVISITFSVASLTLAKQALDVSVRSLEVSVQSFELSLAIACAEANATDTLPAFCK
ncbi:hypothetical protein NW762_010350 [Fusarium torreyae]|uniref:Uncharacterized protein n=1 Tax=Fusarium torreyae TaxID=1237075 RepID=A0A9W8VB07_9HYPO|nr:hypothetical protein NW762_010350 [Fusarium torreyae]